jgi:hypothetical protein
MTRRGDRLENPVTGDVLTFHLSLRSLQGVVDLHLLPQPHGFEGFLSSEVASVQDDPPVAEPKH